jgi:predicted hydrocarbon binding protein
MVHIVAWLTDEPGALASLLNALGSKVNLIGTSSYSTEGNTAIFSGFGKALTESVSSKSLQKEVVRLPKVRRCQVWESKEGLLVDRFHTGFRAGADEPYLMFPSKALSEAFERIVKTFGSGGETIVYTYGMDYAKSRGPLYKKMMGPHPETRLDELTAIVGALGYGKSVATIESSGKALKLTCRECFECSTPSEHKRTCAFLRGLSVGIFSSLFGKELVCEETKCRQKGDQQCEFVLTAKDKKPLIR